MKILVISFEFPPDPGGMGEYAYQTALKLSEKHQVTALVTYKNLTGQNYPSFKSRQPFQIEEIKGYNGRTSFIIKKYFYFVKFFKKNKFDLIVVVTPSAGIISWYYKQHFSIPYIMIGHGSEFLSINFFRDYLIKTYYNAANLILANSHFTKSLIDKSAISNTQVQIVFPGADEVLFNLMNHPKKLNPDKNIILSVGALSKRKGHLFTLEAMALLKEETLNFEYWIIGMGDEREKIEKYILTHNLQSHVKVIGFVQREDLPTYYANASVLILNSNNSDPSQVEGFGIVLIEAHLMQVPVIGAKQTGMVDAVVQDENGLLVDPTNPLEIKTALLKILTNKTLQQEFGLNGYKRAKLHFTWAVFGEKINSLVDDLV